MQHMTTVPVKGKTTSTPTATPAGSSAYPIILESFEVDGNNWKKVYSDGWIEQGGYSEPATMAGYAERTITFNWPFTTACITVNCQPTCSGTGGGDAGMYGIRDVSTTGFTFTRGTGTQYTTGIYWTARGI